MRRATVCYSNYSLAACKSFFFGSPTWRGCRNGQGCSYCRRICRNGGFATAVVVGEESRVRFWKFEKEEKFRALFSITPRKINVIPEMSRAKNISKWSSRETGSF